MSIAPFLPGLPVPAAPDGAATPDASTGDPGSAGSAFGDALAAALAGTLVVVPDGNAPATTAAAPVPTLPPVDLPVSPVDLAVPPVESPVPPVDLAVPPVDLAVPPVELAVPPVDVGFAAVDLGVPQHGGPEPTAATARRTTDRSAVLASVLLPAPAPTGGALESVVGSPDSTAAKADSMVANPNSTAANADSTVANPNSTAANANSTAVTKAVVQQVFPEVTRVVSTVIAPAPGATGPANGTHRITLTLQPEQLGEVRVTLVVRDGAVHVRLAGAEGVEGAAVHRALAGEAPELQRILERTGAEARVTVRDPFAPLPPPAPAGSAPASTSTQTGPDAHARSDAQDRRDDSTREQPREQPRRQEPQRASYPAPPTPVAGRLDRTV